MRFFDLHCDTVTRCFDQNRSLLNGDQEVSLEKAQALDNWGQLFAVFVDDDSPDPFDQYKQYTAFFKAELQTCSDRIKQCETADDIAAAFAARKCAAILAVENAAVVAGDPDNIIRMAREGVKVVTLTWNGENELGFGSAVGGHLKPFGKQAVAEMARNRMLIDVSHLSDEGFEDVMALCGAQVLATHSNLRSVCGHPRNLTDAQFLTLMERGGIVGLNLHKPFLNDEEAAASDAEALFAHVDKMLKLGGENKIAFGSDFDGAKMPDFCKDISGIPLLRELFVARYGAELAEKVFFSNAYDFFCRQLV